MISITTQVEFAVQVLQSDKPVVVDFWADWCGPCKVLTPLLATIATELSDIKFVKINVQDLPALANDYGISMLPTLLVIKDGAVLTQLGSYKSKADLKEKIINATLLY